MRSSKYVISRLILFLVLFSLSASVSCQKPAALDTIVVCESINEKTLEPQGITNNFDIRVKRIYCTVKYNAARAKDYYCFTWTNLETGEKITSGKYDFSGRKDLMSGYLVSVMELKEGQAVMSPGNYRVELFYNGKLVNQAAEFEIKKPVLEITSVNLTNSVNKDSSPSGITAEFKQTDTIYACVKANFQINGNIVKARWLDSNGALLLETPYKINEDNYNSFYIPFGLQNNKGILPEGQYKIEVYLNEKLFKTLDFTVVKTDMNISSFKKALRYTNIRSGFSFIVPDEWKFYEFENKDGIQVQLVPPSTNMEIGFLLMENKNITDFSEKSFEIISSDIVKPFISEKGLIEVNVNKDSATSLNNIEYYEIIRGFKDKNNQDWLSPFCFIKHEGKLFLLYGIVNRSTFGKEASVIFYGIIDSLEFE